MNTSKKGGGDCAVSRIVALTVLVSSAALLSGCPQPATLDTQPPPNAVHWLHFAQISDIHIVDSESPARAVRADRLIQYSWRPQEAYTTQVLDATVRVLDEHNESDGHLDFLIVTGDISDSAQHNELRWFMDTMDGKIVTPDSGALDGPQLNVPPEDNPHLPFQAVGLDKDVPWYAVYGNHDELAVGVFGIDRRFRNPDDWFSWQLGPVAYVLGLNLLNPPLHALIPTRDQSPAIIRADKEDIDPTTLQLRIQDLKAGPIVPDERRHFSSREEFMQAHFNTTTKPAGHGFTQANLDSGRTRYAVVPKPGVPVRLVVMDTVAPDPPAGFPVQYGVMTREQFNNFVKPQFQAARDAGQYVILASHHPSADFDLPYFQPTVKTKEFRHYVSSQPNIIAHICGHTHRNHVTQVDGRYPYLEIETDSLIDYPQEGRILDVYYIPSTHSIKLVSTMFSHMDDPTRLSAESYRRATIDVQYRTKSDANAWTKLFPDPQTQYGAACTMSPKLTGDMPLTAGESYGRPSDRDFSVTFSRP